uniref:Uncharacterized protein n=1 Tax=Aplanochytrium stocchinoi TaxID=215587 RepID=A0A6S8E4U9_9STRA|mmetsp:Transcript_19801/g.24014  ORF Transcript_19801/g.24014 Transcript_19801/m.24014 type:complete len:373 (+) Transcript_19801:225-1343(+)
MGLCTSMSEAEKEQAAQTRAIDKQMKRAQQEQNRIVKLLLLGAGESGKSTLFKQMQIIYGVNKGFTVAQKVNMKPVVHANIITNMKQLLSSTETHTPVTETNQGIMKEILAYAATQAIDEAMAGKLKTIWADEGVQKTWSNRGDIQVQDALEYYMASENIERISKEDYLPVEQDILRSRVRTSGIVEEEFEIDDTHFVMFDVGGQRNERRKWIHAFEDVHAVIFVAAISEFNQVLYEDNSQNRQDEAVELFRQMCELKWFEKSGMILFLNKSDLFREKLKTIPFKVTEGENKRNTDYTGAEWDPENPGTDAEFEQVYNDTKNYLIALYEKQAGGKEIYIHITCATDTNNITVIMNACKDIFLRNNLKDNGFA